MSTPTGTAHPVLVAVDFSDDARAAARWAIQHADRCGAPLLVLHVVHDPAADPGFYQAENATTLTPMVEAAEKRLAVFLERLRSEEPESTALRNAETLLVPGLPPGRIVEVAEDKDVGLVVVGSRGRTGLAHILLGSVAERVVQLSPYPVVVVKNNAAATPP